MVETRFRSRALRLFWAYVNRQIHWPLHPLGLKEYTPIPCQVYGYYKQLLLHTEIIEAGLVELTYFLIRNVAARPDHQSFFPKMLVVEGVLKLSS